jgi:flagellar biosynthesis/type III secretory pathway protein FliH
MGFDRVPPDWIETLVERMAALIDNRETIYQSGFEEGFQQGVEHATDDFK